MLSKELRRIRWPFALSGRYLLCVLLALPGYWTSPIAALGQEEHSKSSAANLAPDPCALLSSSEIEKVQGEGFADRKLSQQPGGSFVLRACFYRTPTFTKSISLSLAVPNEGQGQDGPREFWMKHFHDADNSQDGQLANERRPEKKKEEAEQETKPVEVPGLGEQAYWIANPHIGTLYVLQEKYFLRISLGGKDSNDVRSNKAKDLARTALRRLKSARTPT